MRSEEFFYNSADEKTKIHAIYWLPDGETKGIIQIAHGVTEYIERYKSFAEYFTKKAIL